MPNATGLTTLPRSNPQLEPPTIQRPQQRGPDRRYQPESRGDADRPPSRPGALQQRPQRDDQKHDREDHAEGPVGGSFDLVFPAQFLVRHIRLGRVGPVPSPKVAGIMGYAQEIFHAAGPRNT